MARIFNSITIVVSSAIVGYMISLYLNYDPMHAAIERAVLVAYAGM